MAFFGLLKKKEKFYEEPITKDSNNIMDIDDPSKPDPIAQMMANIPDSSSQKTLKTYDILVLEPNPDGTKKQFAVNGVKAHSPKELMALYAADGAQIRILKEYGATQQSAPQATQQQQPQFKMREFSDPAAALNKPVEPELKQAFHEFMKAPVKEPPKYFEIGGVKCKLENGKMYQEQWVKVDASKYRLIADATNKLISMNGKHLETLKWVQIENTEEKEGDVENA